MKSIQNFWSYSTGKIFENLNSNINGLSSNEAMERMKFHGENSIKSKKKNTKIKVLLNQFKSPVVLILLFATCLSIYVGETIDAIIIFVIVLLSGILGFIQEYSANKAVQKLLDIVQIKTNVLRDNQIISISVSNIVPGDIVVLKAGDAVPGDCYILESVSMFIDESTLTGETYPAEKQSGILSEEKDMSERSNCLWMGTHVISGTCKAIVVNTGKNTEFGKIAEKLKLSEPETEFEKGIRKFGYLLIIITLILVFSIFIINTIFNKALLDSFMFSLALAVGLTPQLLPVIISTNLSKGAKKMAKMKVIVKKLSSIENLGSMDVLCSDKTGTLTDGVVKLNDTLDVLGKHNSKVFLYAYLNAYFESGFINPIDVALRACEAPDITKYTKLDEEPYDFIRKRLSILVSYKEENHEEKNIIISKGSYNKIIEICKYAEKENGLIVPIEEVIDQLNEKYQDYSNTGYRTLGIAYKNNDKNVLIDRTDETKMIFFGFITLADTPKPGIADTIKELKKLGVSLKIVTGDNKYIAQSVMKQIGVSDAAILTGSELREINDIALINRVKRIQVFAEIEPNQKERIVLALKKAGHVVGYMGDGINDVSALHDADVSISVDSAVDVAKEAANIVLLEKDLNVLIQGVLAGRTTFANTMKYVFMAVSANFGNMFSMAGASAFLSYLPLLPKQVLLTNILTDLPEVAIATDNVSQEVISKPKRWDISFIKKFMLTFGLVSSIFDYMTFGALLYIVNATEAEFRTGWFTESVISAALIVLVIRSKKLFIKSNPSKQLVITTLAIVLVTLILPITPIAGLLGLTPISFKILGVIFVIVFMYILTAEVVKYFFYKHVKY